MHRPLTLLHPQNNSIAPSVSGSTQQVDALWVTVSPTLGIFDQPLQYSLANQVTLAKWQYAQEADESCEIAKAVSLLQDYMKTLAGPIHLLGHGLGGAVALLYARLHPEAVKSLTLFAVAEQPAVTWHAHYYVQRHLVPCSQIRVLAQMAGSLFHQQPYAPAKLVEAMRQDLEKAPLLHSACHLESLPQGGVEVPLMVCGAKDDAVVHPAALADWSRWLKPGDRQYLCSNGGHFFHHSQSDQLAQEIVGFWERQSTQAWVGLAQEQKAESSLNSN